ncbi:MAG TPA: hypothetical protein VF808_19815, partial [Ktedonobacterales bacterium]
MCPPCANNRWGFKGDQRKRGRSGRAAAATHADEQAHFHHTHGDARSQPVANGLLVGAPQGFQSPNTGSSVPATSAVLDASSYGGYYLATTLTSSGFNP